MLDEFPTDFSSLQCALLSSIFINGPDSEKKMLKEVLSFVDRNFQKFRIPQNITSLLPVLDQAVKHGDGDSDISLQLSGLIAAHLNETDLSVVLQIIYQILKSVEKNTFQLKQESLLTLLDFLLTSQNKNLNANILTCIQLYSQMYQDFYLLEKLWIHCVVSNVEHIESLQQRAQILVHLFDDFEKCIKNFHLNGQLLEIITQLLISDCREQRKSAYFLMKKILHARISSLSEFDLTATLRRDWTAYITINENLEENQSHLILPSLEMLYSIEKQGAFLENWIDILYTKILSHNNILVIRWSLEYILQTFTCAELNTRVLQQFLECTNNTSLFNWEGYFLPKKHLSKFLNCDLISFYESFALINWKPVPLHFWLAQLQTEEKSLATLNNELIMRIATRVRTLPNTNLRKEAIELFEAVFATSINSLNLIDYFVFIESLYNVTDPFRQWEIFSTKVEQSMSITCTKRIYEILTNQLLWMDDESKSLFNVLAKRLSTEPKEAHGWWRFLMVYDMDIESPAVTEFCRLHYDLDLTSLVVDVISEEFSLNSIIHQTVNKLGGSKSEDVLVFRKTIDFIVQYRLHTFSDYTKCASATKGGSTIIDICSIKTFVKLSALIASHKMELDEEMFESLLYGLKRFSKDVVNHNKLFLIVKNLLVHCKNIMPPAKAKSRAESILDVDYENYDICRAVLGSGIEISRKCYIRGMLSVESKSGDARIEDFYAFNCTKSHRSPVRTRCCYISKLPKEQELRIMNHLISCNNDISRKRPRYFENCKEHRSKMRIVRVLFYIILNTNDIIVPIDAMWNILLEQNNQINITVAYELLIAKSVPNFSFIMDKLKEVSKYTPSQQVSLISVAHAYCLFNLKRMVQERTTLGEVVNILLPLTMGANFQTRLYAQLSIYSILNRIGNDLSAPSTYNANQLLHAIGATIGEKISELMEDIRMKYFDICEHGCYSFDILMYISCSPYDEYNQPPMFEKFNKSRNFFLQKIKKHESPYVQAPKLDVSHLQRKLNPTGDILVKHNFTVFSKCQQNEIFVVASLVDKLPNLGGIARSCEVLGVHNLVIASKSLIEKAEFKNLSMTAEKSLNSIEIKPPALIDFLMQKRTAGYQIVGAEQCDTSVSLTTFEFPRRCILLLGHEKNGIPSNLLGFLDSAVEIPQFGMVRSLNVHVTAALFMWEYCKQHLIKY